MTTTEPVAAWTAILAIVLYQLTLVGLIFLRPDLNPAWHTISEWAIGPNGWVMSLAFFMSAVSYAATWVLVRPHVRGVTGGVGLWLLGVCVVGALGVSIFTTDPLGTPPSALSSTGRLHVLFGTIQLVLLPFAALLLGLSLGRKSAAWSAVRRVLLATAGLPLAGFLGFVAYTVLFVVPLGPGAYGPGVNIGWPPRFAFFAYAVWVVTLASQALRLRHREKPRAERVPG